MKNTSEKKVLIYVRNRKTGKLEICSNQPLTHEDVIYVQKQLNCKLKNYPYNF